MSVLLNGSTDYFRRSGVTGTAYPCSQAGWVKPANVAQDTTIGGFSMVGNDLNFGTMNSNTTNARTFCRFAGVDSIATKAGLIAAAWQSIVVVWVSATSKFVYLNGASATDVTNTAIPAFDVFLIGGRERSSGPENFFAGSVSYYSVHNVALSASDAAAHAAGQNPATLPGCIHLFPLSANANDSVGAWVLASNGTPAFSSSDNPPVITSLDWTAAQRTPDRTPDSFPQDRQRLLRQRRPRR